jgi:hypothetical protein
MRSTGIVKGAVLFMGLALGAATGARAELIVRFQQRRVSGDVATQAEGKITLGHDRIACGMDAVQGTPPPPRFVYRSDLQLLWTIQPLWKWYSQEDSVTASAMRSMHKGDLHDDVGARILQRSAAERAQAEADERARQAALHADGEQPEWRLEMWVAPWSAVGITPDERAAPLDLGRTMERWWRGTRADGRLVFAFRALPQLEGFPVRIRQFHAGTLTTEYTFSVARRHDVTPGLYVLPPGFARREG